VITYEYPLNEKVRTLLRLEDLYEKVRYFLGNTEPLQHHVALVTLFEILDVATRADFKSDLLQELERQKHTLDGYRSHPNVDVAKLDEAIQEIERTSASLLAAAGKFGQHLRDNEWLMGIKQRCGIPGGACRFDLPSYHYWLQQDEQVRMRDLSQWLDPTWPIYEGTRIVLRLLRESARPATVLARQGMYSQVPAGRVAQMIRISLSRSYACVPEISANKYALNIRFVGVGAAGRPPAYERDVEFGLGFCNF
jgi:cell division protein ZapD